LNEGYATSTKGEDKTYFPPLDSAGYAPSIMPNHDEFTCWLCGRNGDMGKLDRHEIYRESFGGADRKRSKGFGLWVYLCHNRCHLHGVHANHELDLKLKREGQRVAMEHYGWTTEEFIEVFGKNYL